MEDNIQVTESTPTEKTFTQSEVDALVSTAVNNAVAKAKQKASKTSEERITELEKEIARRDNMDYARTKLTEAGIDMSLLSLVTASSNEDTDARIEALSSWYSGAVEKGVADVIKESKPIKFQQTQATNKPRTLAERQAQYDNTH